MAALRSQLRSRTRRRNLIVKQTGQEIGIILTGDLGGKVPRSEMVLVPFTSLGGEAVGLFLQETKSIVLGESHAFGGLDVVL